MSIDAVATPLGHSQIASVAAATGFASVPPGTLFALISAENGDVRWRDDGVDPTDSLGMLLTTGQTLVYNGPVTKLKFIDADGGAVVNGAFYGR